ncbi:MAG: ABC transporter ATP-binding protein [Rhodocyclaceae bacterium]
MNATPFHGGPATCSLDALTLHAGGRADGRMLCSDLSLHFAPGERWVVLGPNGAGKSTLIATLAGLSAPYAGAVHIDGAPIARARPQSLARRRSWCPQFWLDPFAAAAWETVACAIEATHPELSADDTQRTAREWLARFDMGALADNDVRALSGGERQRVALATAFAQRAPLVLLDEPTAHLDWAHQVLLRDVLFDWSAAGGTIVTAVHDINLAWTISTHALLFNGRGRVRWGSREEILTAEQLSNAYDIDISVRNEDGARWFRVELGAPENRR